MFSFPPFIKYSSDKGNNVVYLRNFSGAEKKQWYDRWIHITIDNEAHLVEPPAKVAGVPGQLGDTLLAWRYKFTTEVRYLHVITRISIETEKKQKSTGGTFTSHKFGETITYPDNMKINSRHVPSFVPSLPDIMFMDAMTCLQTAGAMLMAYDVLWEFLRRWSMTFWKEENMQSQWDVVACFFMKQESKLDKGTCDMSPDVMQ